MSMPRGAPSSYPKDSARSSNGRHLPGRDGRRGRCRQRGAVHVLLRAIGERGRLLSFERRETSPTSPVATVGVLRWGPPAWTVTVGDLVESLPTVAPAGTVDRVVLDIAGSVGVPRCRLRGPDPGSVLICYVRHDDPAEPGGRGHPRPWRLHRTVRLGVARARGTLEGLAVRPQHRCTDTPASSSRRVASPLASSRPSASAVRQGCLRRRDRNGRHRRHRGRRRRRGVESPRSSRDRRRLPTSRRRVDARSARRAGQERQDDPTRAPITG